MLFCLLLLDSVCKKYALHCCCIPFVRSQHYCNDVVEFGFVSSEHYGNIVLLHVVVELRVVRSQNYTVVLTHSKTEFNNMKQNNITVVTTVILFCLPLLLDSVSKGVSTTVMLLCLMLLLL